MQPPDGLDEIATNEDVDKGQNQWIHWGIVRRGGAAIVLEAVAVQQSPRSVHVCVRVLVNARPERRYPEQLPTTEQNHEAKHDTIRAFAIACSLKIGRGQHGLFQDD